MVVVLADRREIGALCRFPWLDLRQEVENVLWWKAQASGTRRQHVDVGCALLLCFVILPCRCFDLLWFFL